MTKRFALWTVSLLMLACVSLAGCRQETHPPRLVDLGAHSCIPCKKMAPILEELRQEYTGVLIVEFIDVWEHPEKGKEYGVESIPTQIFFDPDGHEQFRHVGFLSKEDILAKWEELGYELKPSTPPAAPESSK